MEKKLIYFIGSRKAPTDIMGDPAEIYEFYDFLCDTSFKLYITIYSDLLSSYGCYTAYSGTEDIEKDFLVLWEIPSDVPLETIKKEYNNWREKIDEDYTGTLSTSYIDQLIYKKYSDSETPKEKIVREELARILEL